MSKKGFTLIELLAVIIILAIVALIATPIILEVIEDARSSAAESEAGMIVSGIENGCARAQLNGTNCPTELTLEILKTYVDLNQVELVKIETTGEFATGDGREAADGDVVAILSASGQVEKATVISNGYDVAITNGTVGEAK